MGFDGHVRGWWDSARALAPLPTGHPATPISDWLSASLHSTVTPRVPLCDVSTWPRQTLFLHQKQVTWDDPDSNQRTTDLESDTEMTTKTPDDDDDDQRLARSTHSVRRFGMVSVLTNMPCIGWSTLLDVPLGNVWAQRDRLFRSRRPWAAGLKAECAIVCAHS